MQKELRATIQVGDWVSGISINDEAIRGYVEAVDTTLGTAKIHVLESDNESSVGKTAESLLRRVRRQSDTVPDNEEAIRQLIDLALSMKDEEWFRELSGMLLSAGNPKPDIRKKWKEPRSLPSRRW